MVKEHISLPDHLENVLAGIRKCRNYSRGIFRLFILVEAILAVHLHQHSQIQRPVDVENILFLNVKFLFQNAKKSGIDLILHFQADHLAPLALFQLLLDLHQKILSSVLVNGKVRISHNTVRMRADYIITQEKLVNIPLNDFLQKDHGSILFLCRRNHDHTGQHRRYLNGGKHQNLLAFFLILFGNQSSDVQSLISDQRKRSGRIHCHRGKHRIHIILKITVHIRLLLLIQFLMLHHKVKPYLLKSRQKGTVQGAVLGTHQLMGLCADLL